MVRALLLGGLIGLASCHRTAPPVASSTAPPAPDAAPEESACARHTALHARVDSCTQLSDEVRQQIVQRDTDMGATISESGMEGATPVDEEQLCEEEIEFLLRVAAEPCGLR